MPTLSRSLYRPSIRSLLSPAPGVGRLAMALLAANAAAQTPVARPPLAEYWMDISTVSLADMPPMRKLDLAVATQRNPAALQATQTIPPGMAMGPTLTLLPSESTGSQDASARREAGAFPPAPKGRILLYWGCGDAVREGQPKVLDFTTSTAQEYDRFMAGRGARQHATPVTPGRAVWPNTQPPQSIPKGATLTGQHTVTGEGLPAGMRFTVPAEHDWMPPLALSGAGGGGRATTLRWTGLPTAHAYFLNATGSTAAPGGQDTVVWSSSELPEPGWGLIDYLDAAQLHAWLGDKVLLPAGRTECAIPAGIFAKTDGATVQGIAYGPERLWSPAPGWSARMRLKSQSLLPLEQGGEASRIQQDKPLVPSIPGVPDLGSTLGGALKGLFGR